MNRELDLEQRCRRLIGLKVRTVQYYGNFRIFEKTHGVSKAIYWITAEDEIFRFGFEDEFSLRWGFGISVKKVGRIFPDDREEEFRDATLLWKDSFVIKDVRLHWRYISDSRRVLWHHYSRSDYPQDLELILSEGESIFIGATEILDENKCKLFTNHLTVFFDAKQRERFYENAILW
ncbi:hypothetical protein [Leptospira adleri]|uniref:Uncharacterized protein n=1 Tax=Leptospira adleri TaxID=2023186 RepID=A0A2M9YIQ5_9LEPT|nr:hypothetical protein [Leptospira adleri]PJZ51429.1 hypothetical protein CH380_19920 [Leptospira adleri]PJZ61670.1 hypothetical protein CH376_11800 [Leptospira adleri]